MECSVLFAYTLDAQGRPEIWEIRFISDKDCGTRLETFRLNADSANSNADSANSKEKFRPTPPPFDKKENVYRLDRIYKAQIQDDRQGFCSPPKDYDNCLFLLETVPAPAFQYKNTAGNFLSGGVLDFGGSRTLCGLTTFQSFDAQLLLSPLVAPYGQALWRFTAEIQKNAPLLEWKRFSFFSKALDKGDHGDPISGEVSFLNKEKQRLSDSLVPALKDTEQTPGRQWNFPIDDVSSTPPSPRFLVSSARSWTLFPQETVLASLSRSASLFSQSTRTTQRTESPSRSSPFPRGRAKCPLPPSMTIEVWP